MISLRTRSDELLRIVASRKAAGLGTFGGEIILPVGALVRAVIADDNEVVERSWIRTVKTSF